jgi:hypothetical protein
MAGQDTRSAGQGAASSFRAPQAWRVGGLAERRGRVAVSVCAAPGLVERLLTHSEALWVWLSSWALWGLSRSVRSDTPVDLSRSAVVGQLAEIGDREDSQGAAPPGTGVSGARCRSSLRRGRRRRERMRRLVAAGLVVLTMFVMVVGWSIAGALTAPGTDSVAARMAEWGRDHGFDELITWLEKQQYERNQPATSGVPAGGITLPEGWLPDTSPGPGSGALARHVALPAPAPLPPPPGLTALADEGQWHTVVMVKGKPAVRVAYVRPDSDHTSFLTGVMWMDPTLVSGQLRPGFQDPGGTWRAAMSLTTSEQHTVAAVFNAGFRLNGASHGGYYSEGRTVRPLVDGAASLVLRTDGTATVGTWNSEVKMGTDVASVRQNLVPLVDAGQLNPTCQTGGTAEWGSTIGQAAYIHRSAFGVSATGAEIYVGGPALSVCNLGRVLRDAGAMRGMELDINPSWVSGTYFHTTPHGHPRGFRLFPDEQVSPEHYLSPSSRDWYAFTARP